MSKDVDEISEDLKELSEEFEKDEKEDMENGEKIKNIELALEQLFSSRNTIPAKVLKFSLYRLED